jgi:N-acetylmuramoyl-L-alanine amidase
VSPERPKPVSKDGFHFEIDQTKQVLYIVAEGKVRTIVHTSTGANGYTRDGVWTVHREIEGYSPGRLYYPSYFDGARAVHGWPEVPTYPASHGCARVPMWIAPWLNGKAHVGMTVRVYHS